jgi:hypothetical protein
LLKIRIWSDQSFVPDGADLVNHPTRQSFRIQSIEFKKQDLPTHAAAR